MILNNKTTCSYSIVGFMILMILSGCSQKKEIKGSEYIPRETLVKIIRDMHLMDGITNDMKYYRKFNPGDSIDLYSSIFEKYEVDQKTYKRTINEYSKYPGLLNKVYDDVLTELNLMLDQLEEERKKLFEEKAKENQKDAQIKR